MDTETRRTSAAEAAADGVNVIGQAREQFVDGFGWGTHHPNATIPVRANRYWWERGAARGQAASRLAQSITERHEETS